MLYEVNCVKPQNLLEMCSLPLNVAASCPDLASWLQRSRVNWKASGRRYTLPSLVIQYLTQIVVD